ncbi:hypothetical protein [Leptolyngbya sp. FACHB-8]
MYYEKAVKLFSLTLGIVLAGLMLFAPAADAIALYIRVTSAVIASWFIVYTIAEIHLLGPGLKKLQGEMKDLFRMIADLQRINNELFRENDDLKRLLQEHGIEMHALLSEEEGGDA